MTRKRKTTKSSLLPASFSAWLWRRAYELVGMKLIAFAGFAFTAIYDYHPTDPSFNTAVDGKPLNSTGIMGSYIADLLYQLLGSVSYCVPLLIFAWGINLILRRPVDRFMLRLLSAIIGLQFAAGALALIRSFSFNFSDFAHNITYNLSYGTLGNFLGNKVLLSLSLTPFNQKRLIALLMISAIVLGISSFLLIVYAMKISWSEINDCLQRYLLRFKKTLKLVRKTIKIVDYILTNVMSKFSEIYPSLKQLLPAPFTVGRKKAPNSSLEQSIFTKSPNPEVNDNRSVGLKTIESLLSLNKELSIESNKQQNTESTKEVEIQSLLGSSTANLPTNLPTNLSGKLPAGHSISPIVGSFAKRQKKDMADNVVETYNLPPLSLVEREVRNDGKPGVDHQMLRNQALKLESVLQDFGIKGEIVKIRPGPVVTLYELKPAAGIKSSRVISLSDDIARSMSAWSARVAVIPGQEVLGIELSNPDREIVYLYDTLASKAYEKSTAPLALILGKDIGGEVKIADLAKMPHLLIAGTTGSGKSVAVNVMILSLLYRLSPKQCKFIMIDPKMLELSVYDGIPHLLSPVVTDPKKAVVALKWVVREMESRYRAMSMLGVRNIEGYNNRVNEARASGQPLTRKVQVGFDEDGGPVYEDQVIAEDNFSYIVVIVDEMADLMLVAGKEIEAAVQRLAQMARAAGIHLIMATQRPSVDVITGTIKANFPTRISFKLASKVDSRTVHGEQGAEQLLGHGDMLYMGQDVAAITRLHGPFVSDNEVRKVVEFVKQQEAPNYVDTLTENIDGGEDAFDNFVEDDANGGSDEQLYRKALEIVMAEGRVSTSFLQRRLVIGYNRAARLVEKMEAEGIVSSPSHTGKRQLLQRL